MRHSSSRVSSAEVDAAPPGPPQELISPLHDTKPKCANYCNSSLTRRSTTVSGDTMSTLPAFRHRPLGDVHDHIRVIELAPASSLDAPLYCQIRHVRLGKPLNPYYTLSYAWGQPCRTGIIHIRYEDDDLFRPFRITNSLEMGLRQVRARQAEGEDDLPFGALPLWVDAVCIDQSDDEEKGCQVGIMADIYSNAAGLVIWLGDTEPVQYDHDLEELVRRRRDYKLFNRDVDDQIQSYLAVMLQAEWFERRWCIQEYLSSAPANIHVLFGAQSIPCHDLIPLLMDAGLLGRAGVLQTPLKDETASLLEHLQRFSHYKCGNELDLVFSLLSISDYQSLDGVALAPDYTIYTSHLFQQIAARYCNVDFLIPLLICASIRKGNLSRRFSLDDCFSDWMPSWVPDWRNTVAYESDEHYAATNRAGPHFCRPSKTCCDRSCCSTVDGENTSHITHDGCCRYRISSPPDEYGITIVGSTLVLKHYLILSCDTPISEQHVETCPYHRFHHAQICAWNSSSTLSLAEQPLMRSDEAMLIFQRQGERMLYGRKRWYTLHNRIEKRSLHVEDITIDPCRRFWLGEAPKYHGIGFILRTANGGRAQADSVFQLHSCFRCPDLTAEEFPLSRTEVRII